MSIIYTYFPTLSNIFISALAATADYNYTENDQLNNITQIIDQMFKSFGVDENGEAIFKPVWAIQNFTTAQKIERAIKKIGTPPDTPPATPDIFHLRLGAANFFVPPISISVSTGFKTGSLTGGAIRQKSSPKFNSGHRETTINLRLYFPNYEEIWGISIDDASKIVVDSRYKVDFQNEQNTEKIDKFLSSLRGLIAAFKYSPILPIKNHYLNSVHGITGVALSSINLSTVPDYPFAIQVDIELLNFNHKPFLPMLNDFNQAIHWGKYRQYMGRAAGSLYSYINEDFLLESDLVDEASKKQSDSGLNQVTSPILGGPGAYQYNPDTGKTELTNSGVYNTLTDTLTTNVYQEWQNGKNLELYVPAKIQSKIYAPDESTFRTAEEVALTDVGRGFWENILNNFGIDVNESANYHRTLDSVVETSRNTNIPPSLMKRARSVLSVALAGTSHKDIRDKVYEALAVEYISTNKISNKDVADYLLDNRPPEEVEVPGSIGNQAEIDKIIAAKTTIYNNSKTTKGYLSASIDAETNLRARKKKIDISNPNIREAAEWINIQKQVERELVDAFNVSLYNRFFLNADIQNILEAVRSKQGSFSFREWDVPMVRVELDPKNVVINAINVTTGNNLAKMQLQMQDEPTFQHIGAKDSYVNISMTVFGEKELVKLKKTFDFLTGLARMEHAAGVIGFLGIKNVITALAGIKYVMPLQYNVDTIPNYPHAYNVQLSFVDFDVYQQKREKLSSEQQRKFIEDFKSKRNPFLRLKQNWSIFNAYPDMPLMIKDEAGNMLGAIDPDFYFRSFQMYDDDVVNSIIDPEKFHVPLANTINYNEITLAERSIIDRVKKRLIENNASIEDIRDFLIDELRLSPSKAMQIFRYAVFDGNNDTAYERSNLEQGQSLSEVHPNLWQDFIETFVDEFGETHTFEDLKFNTRFGPIRIGDLVSGSQEQISRFNSLIKSSSYNLEQGELPSIDPDEMDFIGVTHYIPSAESGALGRIPAIMQTPDGGFIFGYSSEEDGRFYIASDSLDIEVDSTGKANVKNVRTTKVSDTSASDRDPQDTHTGVAGAQPLQNYMNPYASGEKDKMQSLSNGVYNSPAKHWEKMMLDTQYRDISGRMIRAFPTYMLWLIDEGGYFAGVKLFDNFYGLQSIIDFSIVQSEDILGDTLILRLSNAYQKLTRPELTLSEIVNTGAMYDQASTDLTQGTMQVIDVLLNASRNFANHFDSQYITEIENVRLRPGVRVHLRAGYGANPNSLQTVFNGVITNVENGEILTVVAQSDAIELSPIINSTNKKGDSGKIDGGINTGLWMSEPRDLMVRLLSMGSSRVREAFAHATRGTVFSENKFGIRHFGSILYEPLTEREAQQARDYRNSVGNAFNSVGNNPVTGAMGLAWNGAVNVGTLGMMESAGGSVRTPIVGALRSMWANLSTTRDLEIFKRNIYPGNGIGVAQFLGGDLEDGWTTLASVDPDKVMEQKFGYMDRLSDSSWSRLIEQANRSDSNDASQVLDSITAQNKLIDSSRAVGTTQVIAGTIIGGISPVGAFLGQKLVKSFTGRGTMSVMKTLGLVSDLDDDLYDEVSFRAQTYMRSVWDMFQLCARLLPNYIVAVRPFEDRSTVFYGKPHWLYTSGLVPISTGFPNENQARKDGVQIPSWVSPDDELSKIMQRINKETNPLADANAFAAAGESTLAGAMTTFMRDSITFQNSFAAGAKLNGRVINFGDQNRNEYYVKGEVRSILPVNEGRVQVGFHLPFGGPDGEIKSFVQQDHVQLPFLPARYRYPFFTNRVSGALPSLDFDKILQRSTTFEDYAAKASNIAEIAKAEMNLITAEDGKTKLASKDQSSEYVLNFNFDFSKYASAFNSIAGETTAAYDPSGINTDDISGIEASLEVIMPLPIIDRNSSPELRVGSNGYYEFADKYRDIYQDLDRAYQRNVDFAGVNISFSDWGMPKTAEEEQWHIAMRWPYDPISSQKLGGETNNDFENLKSQALGKFISDYDLSGYELKGTPQDYKKRKVLVYNPDTKQAVVCAPAYFLWNEPAEDKGKRIEAIVSPDAAFALGLLIDQDGRILSAEENMNLLPSANLADQAQAATSGMANADLTKCYFTFVTDDVPLGIVTSSFNRANEFSSSLKDSVLNKSQKMVIGFGKFALNEEYEANKVLDFSETNSIPYISIIGDPFERSETGQRGFSGLKADKYTYSDIIRLLDQEEYSKTVTKGGNYSKYFEIVKSIDRLDELKEQTLIDARNVAENTDFAAVYDPVDPIGLEARGFYDETASAEVKVIAGNGRTLKQAQDIWDQFRWGYHTYESVKAIFAEIYGMDPDDDDPAGNNPIVAIIAGADKSGQIKEFSADNNSYNEFASLLGADWLENGSSQQIADRKEALGIAINEYVDKGFDGFDENSKIKTDPNKGIVDIMNKAIEFRVSFIKDLIKNNVSLLSSSQSLNETTVTSNTNTSSETTNATGQTTDQTTTSGSSTAFQTSQQIAEEYLQQIKTPKQLFLLLVGVFRQKLWEDAYSRAWIVLRPDRKRLVTGGDKESDAWSFRPVDKIWQAFIDYNSTYGKDAAKFKKLLQANAKEGNSATNWMSGGLEDAKDFYNKNIGPIFSVFTTALGNMLNLFRLSMAQMSYGLSEVDNFARQANILNKAYNDSIYYSLGRPGTLLRAVDNPFTREYGEPVVEIREPFQRLHYLSSFTHIIGNAIQENLGGVATQITAVSDGQYPVTVALDKSAPAERQVEKTIETGIYFDNIRGSGFFGVLHPIFHPMETIRGISKTASGEPDELTARRIALAHLKESIKDIYSGEITIIGNADIRPHDLVYLADVYERMYGIFEVEQVVHHFTPEMGFITSITPNAFVSVNDPARWFMSSWVSSHFSIQNLRNDTRLVMASEQGMRLAQANGQIPLDSLAESLRTQMTGGLMYTHGHSALVKDITANIAADALPDVKDQIKAKIKNATGKQDGSLGGALAIGLGAPILTAAATTVGFLVGGPVGAGIGFAGGAVASDLAWSAWKWTRDNVLDQHGCYVQYLNRNGQPMDAGLSFNQGMVVGRYHSKKLLPGILGVRTNVRTAEGNSYIRSDDIFRSMGWKENEISSLIRHISLENAIVNSQILKYSGIGPEKTGLNQFFKAIVVVNKVVDGDTFDVRDVLTGNAYRVRFDGINTSELAQTNIEAAINTGTQESVFNTLTPGGRALKYTFDAVNGKLVVLRISPKTNSSTILTEDDLDAGAVKNNPEYYATAIKGESFATSDDRYMATIFHQTDSDKLQNAIQEVRDIFVSKLVNNEIQESAVVNEVYSRLYDQSIIKKNYTTIYNRLRSLPLIVDYFSSTGSSDPLNDTTIEDRKIFSILVSILVLENVYEKASEWPMVAWDEYYNDGTPATLNWELVANGLAKVYTKGLLFTKSPAQVDIEDEIPIPERVVD